MPILQTVSPTPAELGFFPVGYAWKDPILGELENTSVMIACDADAAVAHLKSLHPHLTRVWAINRKEAL